MSLVDAAIRKLDNFLVYVDDGSRRYGYHWSKEEDALLRQFYGRMPRAEVTRMVNEKLRERTGDPQAERSVGACYQRFQQLGLSAYTGAADEVSVAQAVRLVGLPREHVYDAAWRANELPSRRQGKQRYVKLRDLAIWLVAFRERQLMQTELLEALEGVELISKSAAMLLAGLSETHITRYLDGGVITGWHLPCLRVNRAGDWLVDKSSVEAFMRARVEGRLSEYLDQFPAFLKIQSRINQDVKRLRHAGRVERIREGTKDYHRNLRRTIAEAGLLTVRDLMARWGLTREATNARVRREQIPYRSWGRYSVFELADIEAVEKGKVWRQYPPRKRKGGLDGQVG